MAVETLMLGGMLSGVTTLGFVKHRQRRGKRLCQANRQALAEKRSSADGPIKRTDFSSEQVRHHLALSLISLPLLKIPYPPLQLVAIPLVVYSSTLYFKRTFALYQQGRTATAIMDTIFLTGVLATGQFFAFALSCALYLISLRLLIKTEDHSVQNLVGFLKEQPRTVWLWREGVEIETPIDAVAAGDLVVVHAGEVMPVDGVIVDGVASIDQRNLTGEAQPVEREAGAVVFALTTVLSGRVRVRVEQAGADTVAANVARILTNTSDFKQRIQSRGERMVDQGSLPTLVMAAFALPLGSESALAALNTGFGYQMRIAAPISVLNYLAVASRHGCLIKDGRSLELLSDIDTLVFDKTGTLTEEQPTIDRIHCLRGFDEHTVLTHAATAEFKQTHPIARAIQALAQQRGLTLPTIADASYEIGYGIQVSLPATPEQPAQRIQVGSARFMQMHAITLPAEVAQRQEQCRDAGHSLVYVALDDQLIGVIELHPSIRPEAKTMVAELRQRGLRLCILSGDHEQPTRRLAQALGIEEYFAEVLPEDKARIIERLQAEGRQVCFVGDGINDSIALKKAQVSISLSGASSIAVDAAAIVLMDGNLAKLPLLFDIGQAFAGNLRNGFRISIASGALCIGGIFLLGWGLVASILIYNASRVVSVTNAMLPLLSKDARPAAIAVTDPPDPDELLQKPPRTERLPPSRPDSDVLA
jgi:Cu2+-exporting ATPase